MVIASVDRFLVGLTAVSLLAMLLLIINPRSIAQPTYQQVRHAIWESDRPSTALQQLLTTFNIDPSGSLKEIVDATQKTFLRSPNAERWQVEDLSAEMKKQIAPLMDQLYLTQEVVPAQKNYDYAFILGATASRMFKRFVHLIQLLNSGQITVEKQILALVGERPLDSNLETPEKIVDVLQKVCGGMLKSPTVEMPTDLRTEADAMRWLVAHVQLPKNTSITVISAPMKQKSDGSFARPTTGDTIKLAVDHVKGRGDEVSQQSFVVVSSQPYVVYQGTVTESFTPPHTAIDVIGAASVEDNYAVLLDTIARCLYQELEWRKSAHQ